MTSHFTSLVWMLELLKSSQLSSDTLSVSLSLQFLLMFICLDTGTAF